MEHYLVLLVFSYLLIYLLIFSLDSHQWKAKQAQRQQLHSKALMDKELFEVYLEDKGITQPLQRSSLRLSQPYWS